MKNIFYFLLIILITVSCKTTSQNENNNNLIVINNIVDTNITLHILLNNPNKYMDSTVNLIGEFLGFSGKDCNFPSNFSPMITRSDWIFKDSIYCIYVTKGDPKELNSMKKESFGTKIVLKAKCKQKDNKIYLEYIKSEIIQ